MNTQTDKLVITLPAVVDESTLPSLNWSLAVDILGLNIFAALPILQNVQIGFTDYLDSTSSLVDEHGVQVPIMKGVDRHNRPFVSFQLRCFSEGLQPIWCIFTMFQRYSDSDLWVLCESHSTTYGTSRFESAVGATTTIDTKAKVRLCELFECYRRGIPWSVIRDSHTREYCIRSAIRD